MPGGSKPIPGTKIERATLRLFLPEITGKFLPESKVKTLYNDFFLAYLIEINWDGKNKGCVNCNDRPVVLPRKIGGRRVYILLECAVIVMLTVGIGTGLFLAAALTVILKAGWRVAATRSRPLTLRARSQLPEKLSVLHLAEIQIRTNWLNP